MTITVTEPEKNSTTTIGVTFNDKKMYMFMDMLAKKYNEPYTASLREYVSNAYDNHVKNNIRKPIEIFLPTDNSPFLVIKDYGSGMTRQEIEQYFVGFGYSEKDSDNDAIGQFGIGSKSAIAYAPYFIVESIKKYKKNVVKILREEHRQDPTKSKIGYQFLEKDSELSKNNNTTGTTITIPIDTDAIYLFNSNHVKTVLAGWKKSEVIVQNSNSNTYHINDNQLHQTNNNNFLKSVNDNRIPDNSSMVQTQNGYIVKRSLSKESFYPGVEQKNTYDPGFLIGSVFYKLDETLKQALYNKKNNNINHRIFKMWWFNTIVKNTIPSFTPKEIVVSYSREVIENTPDNIQILLNKYNEMYNDYIKYVNDQFKKCNSFYDVLKFCYLYKHDLLVEKNIDDYRVFNGQTIPENYEFDPQHTLGLSIIKPNFFDKNNLKEKANYDTFTTFYTDNIVDLLIKSKKDRLHNTDSFKKRLRILWNAERKGYKIENNALKNTISAMHPTDDSKHFRKQSRVFVTYTNDFKSLPPYVIIGSQIDEKIFDKEINKAKEFLKSSSAKNDVIIHPNISSCSDPDRSDFINRSTVDTVVIQDGIIKTTTASLKKTYDKDILLVVDKDKFLDEFIEIDIRGNRILTNEALFLKKILLSEKEMIVFCNENKLEKYLYEFPQAKIFQDDLFKTLNQHVVNTTEKEIAEKIREDDKIFLMNECFIKLMRKVSRSKSYDNNYYETLLKKLEPYLSIYNILRNDNNDKYQKYDYDMLKNIYKYSQKKIVDYDMPFAYGLKEIISPYKNKDIHQKIIEKMIPLVIDEFEEFRRTFSTNHK